MLFTNFSDTINYPIMQNVFLVSTKMGEHSALKVNLPICFKINKRDKKNAFSQITLPNHE